MPRGLSTEIKAAIAADTLRPVWLLYIDFVGYTLRTWTGDGSVSYDSQTWTGDGHLQGGVDVPESGDIVAEPLQLQLTGKPDTAVDLSDPAVYRGRSCELYLGFLAADGTLPAANVYLVFRGSVSQVSFETDARAEAWRVTVESRLVDLQRVKSARWTHEEQRRRYPGGAVLSSGALVVGELYEVTAAGSGADFSAAGGPASPTLGDRFIATGTSVTWGTGAELTSLPDNGCAYAADARMAIALFRDQDIPGPETRKIIYGQRRVTPTILFAGTSGSASRYLNLVCAVADHECEDIVQVYLDDRAVLSGGTVAGEFVGFVDYYERLGTANQAYISALETEMGSSVWDETRRLRGVTYIYLRLLSSDPLFGDTLPLVEVEVQGKPLYDPRTTSTAYSTNAALAVRDYLLAASGFGAPSSENNDDATETAADVAGALVTTASGGSEPRYSVNGVLDSADTIGENLAQLLSAMAGQLVYAGGEWTARAGVWVAPTVTITEADLADPYVLRTVSRRELSNGAKGVYANPARDWAQEDYPAYLDATAAAADGEERYLVLDQPFATSPSAAQRRAKLEVQESRRSRSLDLLVRPHLLDILTGDIVNVSLVRLGYSSETFRVEGVRIEQRGIELVVRLSLREMASTFYDWDEATEEREVQTFAGFADVLDNWVNAKLAPPSGTPTSQSFSSTFNVTVSHNESGVTCRYTLDGSEPTEADASIADGGTVQIVHNNEDVVLKLKTFEDAGDLESDVVTYTYTAILTAPTPTFENVTIGTPPNAVWHLIWSADSVASDGTTPTTLETRDDGAVGSESNWNSSVNTWVISDRETGFGWTQNYDDYDARVLASGYVTAYGAAPKQMPQPYLHTIYLSSLPYVKPAIWYTQGGEIEYRYRERANSPGSSWGAWSAWDQIIVNATSGNYENLYDQPYNITTGSTTFPLTRNSGTTLRQYEMRYTSSGWIDSASAFIEGEET